MALDQFKLPLSVISHGDAKHMQRELAALDEFIAQANLRKPGTPLKSLPKVTASLTEFCESNKLNLLNETDRQSALGFFKELVDSGPLVHMSFASEPSAAFMRKVATWFRDNINPVVMINVGLEPSIAAGCTLRTDNHFHDFSLRQHFSDQRQLLLNGIKEPLEPQSA